jgi:UDP-N-acetylbacillosamine alanyltransferase
MAAEEMQSLTLGQAVARHERMEATLRPATLHPRYVAADAARNPMLRPLYLTFEAGGECWMHSLHVTDVPGTGLRDASSPYGYGGPVCSTDDPSFVADAWRAYTAWMREYRVAVEYVRFHPMCGNERHYGGHVADNRQVVRVDLTAADISFQYAARLRQAVKKAAGAGLVYEECELGPRAREFGAFHRAAMREMEADPFYVFQDDYFEGLAATGLASLGTCRRSGGSDAGWLGACLFLDSNGLREYHLAATRAEGRKLGASSFALHEGALAAHRRGMQWLYLGGGTDAAADNPLLFFKSGFSPQRLTYRTGWNVFDLAAYDRLKERFAGEWAAHPERPIFYRKV